MNERNEVEALEASRLVVPSRRLGQDPPRIAIAEDDEDMASLLVRCFVKAGFDAAACHNGWDLLKVLGVFPTRRGCADVDLVISDIRLPGISGLDILRVCGYANGAPPIILITAFGDEWLHAEARRLGAVDMLDKPFDIEELVRRVGTLLPPPL